MASFQERIKLQKSPQKISYTKMERNFLKCMPQKRHSKENNDQETWSGHLINHVRTLLYTFILTAYHFYGIENTYGLLIFLKDSP